MKLHWSPKSPFVRKVMVVAHELGCVEQLALQRSVAAMLKPNPAIMADNPLSKIPTLVLENGATLFDSAVICEYLDARFDGGLFPAGDARWPALRWLSFGDGLLDALILWRNERERAQPLQPLVDAFVLKTEASLAMLDGEAAALGNAPFGIGQISIACALGYLDYRFDDFGWRAKAPALAAWFATVSQRPSFAATEPADG
ncbi:MAG: glutathione S-transferase [Pseudoxanthomonas sp.]|jgi:glutathione S-transferase